MRWLIAILVLAGCASEPRQNSEDYYYYPTSPLPRHYQPEDLPQSDWHHHYPQQYTPRNQGWRNYGNVYQPAPCRRTCNHVRTPVNERRWQMPLYKPCFIGYDSSGVPIYTQEIVRPGGWYNITIGYKCRKCGSRL